MTKLALAYGLAVLLSAGLADAEEQPEVDRARETAKEAFSDYQAGRYQEAADKFGQAYRVVRVPKLGRDRARALAKLGLWVEAAELYREVTELELGVGDQKMQEEAKADAARERSELLPRIPKLTLEVEGADPSGVTLAIDGVSLPSASAGTPHLVNPGQHRVVAKSGSQEVVREATLGAGGAETLRLVFPAPQEPVPPPASPPPSPPQTELSPPTDQHDSRSLRRTLGWAAVGLGGAGLVFGGVTRLIAWQKKDDLNKNGCNDAKCYLDQQDDVDSYNSLRVPSTVGLVAGAVVAGGGVALILTAPHRSEPVASPRLVPWVGVGQAGLTGRL